MSFLLWSYPHATLAKLVPILNLENYNRKMSYWLIVRKERGKKGEKKGKCSPNICLTYLSKLPIYFGTFDVF